MQPRLRRSLLLLGALLLPLFASAATVPPRDRILILVSLDGFRWDYLQKFQPTNLLRLANAGVRMERLIPAFPSLTFPNHYTIATGLWPEHHGIIANGFYDPAFGTNFNAFKSSPSQESRWWGGEPIWVTAIKQGRTAACEPWPGTQVEIGGVRPTHWLPFNKAEEPANCVATALAWLAVTNARPSLVTVYFHHPDTAGHHDGPDSPELAATVAKVDAAIGQLVTGLHDLQLDDVANLIILSDHGMAEVSTNRIIELTDFVDAEKVQVDFSGAVAGLRPLDGDPAALYKKFKSAENHFRAYRREQTPKRFHFRNNDRIPPVLLVADEGWYLRRRARTGTSAGTFEKATHGFDPRLKSMGAIFIASGPAFKSRVTLRPEENIHIYNLLCATLGLTPAPNDGDNRLVKKVLRP